MNLSEAEAIINAARPDSVTSNCGNGRGSRKWQVWASWGSLKTTGYGKTCEAAWVALAEQLRRAA